MKKKIFLVALVMLFVASVVVFAVSETEAYTSGYRDGYSKSKIYDQDWQKTIQKSSNWLVYFAGLSKEDQANQRNLKYQYENGFDDGWTDQKAGNRPAR
jgi:exopolysaccharide biosynthesis protein